MNQKDCFYKYFKNLNNSKFKLLYFVRQILNIQIIHNNSFLVVRNVQTKNLQKKKKRNSLLIFISAIPKKIEYLRIDK